MKIVGLIKGRHEMPVDSYIFNEIKDVFDFKTMEKTIVEFLVREVGIETRIGSGLNQNDYTDIQIFKGKSKLVVYITGLTAVTAALIKICAMNGVSLTLMHFNNATCSYEEQHIF